MSLASGCKRGADHFRQIDLAIGLREQQNVGIETAIMDHRVLRIAGRVQYLERWPAMQCFDSQLPSVDRTGHDHIGEQKVDFFNVVDDRQGLAGIARGKRPVAQALNLVDDVLAHQNVILDNQDCFIAALDTRLNGVLQRLSEACRLGQIDFDCGPLTDFAQDFDMPPVSS